jgi:ribosomal-protein-alanine N-acetyltransferase
VVTHAGAAPLEVEVRKMRPADVDAVAAIEAEVFTSPWSAETFAGLLDRPELEVLVLEDAREGIVGYAVLWCVLGQGELANVAVIPRLRGRGLGSYLLTCTLEVARSRGVETIFLEVRVSNERAVELYRRFGFTEVGRRKGYYDRPREDAIVMSARL